MDGRREREMEKVLCPTKWDIMLVAFVLDLFIWVLPIPYLYPSLSPICLSLSLYICLSVVRPSIYEYIAPLLLYSSI